MRKIFRHPRYTAKQILTNEPTAEAEYIKKLIEEANN